MTECASSRSSCCLHWYNYGVRINSNQSFRGFVIKFKVIGSFVRSFVSLIVRCPGPMLSSLSRTLRPMVARSVPNRMMSSTTATFDLEGSFEVRPSILLWNSTQGALHRMAFAHGMDGRSNESSNGGRGNETTTRLLF